MRSQSQATNSPAPEGQLTWTDGSEPFSASSPTRTQVQVDHLSESPLPRQPAKESLARGAVPPAHRGERLRRFIAGQSLILPVADFLAVSAVFLLTRRFPIELLGFYVIFAALTSHFGLSRPRLAPSALHHLPMLTVSLVTSAATIVSLSALHEGILHRNGLPRLLVLVIGAIITLRVAVFVLVREARRRRIGLNRVLILGCGPVAKALAKNLREHPLYGMEPIAFVDDEPMLEKDDIPLLPVLQPLGFLPALVRETGAQGIVVAFSRLPDRMTVRAVRACNRLRIDVAVIPRLYDIASWHDRADAVRSMPLVRLRRPVFGSLGSCTKRLFDVVFASVALAVFAPLALLCAIGVRLEGGPGILFRQERVGLDGRRFQVLKFRSLRPADTAESATRWNVSNDDRLGRVGRFLRKTSMDELPQLWNILRGDMSLVGPRPERPHFVEQFTAQFPSYADRHRIRAGLTGWAQIQGLRGDTSISERAAFDNYYIENWSIWFDVEIILRTVSQVLCARGG